MLEGGPRIHLESSHANPFQLNLTPFPFIKPIWKVPVSRKVQVFLYLMILRKLLAYEGLQNAFHKFFLRQTGVFCVGISLKT